MKILSWNLERPKKSIASEKNNFIIDMIKQLNPDIIFLTETNSSITFDNYFVDQSTALPPLHDGQKYGIGENRISIFSKFPILNTFETYDNYTAVCCEIDSPIGFLTLYGSVIGSLGGKDSLFTNDLKMQKLEVQKLTKNKNLIYSGDFNISFSRFAYPSKTVIAEMNAFFDSNDLVNCTNSNENSAIHIVISNELLKGKNTTQEMIEVDRKISDHNVVLVEFEIF